MENSSVICRSRETALTALETLAEAMPRGLQKEAITAVRNWIEENTLPTRNAEEIQVLFQKYLYDKTPAEQKGEDWYWRGSKKINDEFVPTEPEDGAEWKCLYNAKTKRWEPTTMPPWILEKTPLAAEME
jgi:hypothetical protein